MAQLASCAHPKASHWGGEGGGIPIGPARVVCVWGSPLGFVCGVGRWVCAPAEALPAGGGASRPLGK